MKPEKLDKLVKDMDGINLQVMVNLSGGYGDRLAQGVRNMKGRYKDRFVLFANIDFTRIDEPDYSHRAAAQFEQDIKNGAQGLKIFKNFGMDLKDTKGERIHVDDPRFDEIFEAAGRLHVPVLIHTAEPRSFFQPHDKYNERWLELKQFPGRARPPEKYPSWETLMEEQHRLFGKHPRTTFINAHLGWLGGDLAELGRLMEKYPNMYTEIGAVLAELGRQPRFARQWFIDHQDRVLFGKDIWEPTEYYCYFRVMETADEYFDYYRKRHAFWKMNGLDLPDEVLRKLYYKNALRIVPGIDPAPFPK
jgi:predicted TIM-barrel fold metal-dependent hydrolase